MIAYNKTTLRNIAVQEQVKEAAHHQLLTLEQQRAINKTHPIDLYSPNIFIRIGLGVLTFFIVVAALGLLALASGYHNPAALFIFLGAACYGFLEFITVSKKHYYSGVDNVLMAFVIVLFTVGILEIYRHGNEEIISSFCVFITALYLALRFTDALMGAVATVAILFFLFYSVVTMGSLARQIVPFIIIVACGFLYYVVIKAANKTWAFYYLFMLKAVGIVALVFLYIAGNYYVVRETSIEMLKFNVRKNGDIPFAWFFWFWTMAVPIAYITLGIKKKDLILARLGVILAAFSVLTFRYYHHLVSAEVAMLVAGTVLILLSYLLIKYLRHPQHGFTFQQLDRKHANALDIEGLVIGEAFGDKGTTHRQDTKFGGGSFGGGGAGDSY